MFRNRQCELAYLERRYARSGAEFAVLYGRRRVGNEVAGGVDAEQHQVDVRVRSRAATGM